MRGCHRLPKTQQARWMQYHPPPPNTCQKSAYSLHRPVILWKWGRLLLASCVTMGKVAVDFPPFFFFFHSPVWGGACYCHCQLLNNFQLGVRDISSNGWGCCSPKPVIVVTKSLITEISFMTLVSFQTIRWHPRGNTSWLLQSWITCIEL